MMPDLGKYALWVLASYGVTLGLILAITVVTLLRAARVRRALAEVETARSAAPAQASARSETAPVTEAADG